MKKVLFISSEGGHLMELSKLDFERYDFTIVTEKTESTSYIGEKYPGRTYFLKYGTRKTPIRYFFILIYNYFKSLKIYNSIKPDVVVSTGTHTAVPMCKIAHRKGSKVIWIETFANRTTGTLAGKMVHGIADKFVVQWEEMKEVYPDSSYWGPIF